jgi:hypothetical protein
VAFPSVRIWRNVTAALLATVAILAHAPAFADKPATMLDGAKPVTITAIPATSIATILSERRSASSCKAN